MTTLYMVTGRSGSGEKHVRWGGSMAQVREHKKELIETLGAKRSDVMVGEVEFGTGKAGLLDALNKYATKG